MKSISFMPQSTVQYPVLIGLCGNAGVGKDTFAEQLAFYRLDLHSFAYALKDACEALFGIPLGDFTDQDWKNRTVPYWDKSPRELAQYFGTEICREHFGVDFWIKRLEYTFINCYPAPEEVKAVITDVRFNNEAQWILNRGGILVHLTRPGCNGNVGIPNHASEAGIDFNSLTYRKGRQYEVIEIQNTGTLYDFQKCAESFIRNYFGEKAIPVPVPLFRV